MLTKEQILQRNTGIGGSDIGAVLGLNPYVSPLDVYNVKTGIIEPPDLSNKENVHFGNVLEDFIAKEYARRTGYKVRKRNQHFKHPLAPWMQANIDRSVDGKRMILECKNSSEWMRGKWGEEGTDDVPDYHACQVAWYMAILDYDQAELAALIGGNKMRIYHFDRSMELEGLILKKALRFWAMHVTPKIPPPPSCERDIETLYAVDDGTKLLSTKEITDKVLSLKALKEQIKEKEKEARKLTFDIKVAMGNSSVLYDEKPIVTWRKSKDSRRFDADKLKEDRPDIWEAYAKDVAGSRRFIIK